MATKSKDYTVQASIGIVLVLFTAIVVNVRENNLAQARKDAIIAAASPTPSPSVSPSPTIEPTETVTSRSTKTYSRSYRSSRSRRR